MKEREIERNLTALGKQLADMTAGIAFEDLNEQLAGMTAGIAFEDLNKQLADMTAGIAFEDLNKQLAGMTAGIAFEDLNKQLADMTAGIPFGDLSKQLADMTAGISFDDLYKQVGPVDSLFAVPNLDFSAVRGGVATPPTMPVVAGEPSILRRTTSDADAATDEDLDEVAALVLARRIRRLSAAWSNRTLSHAAERLEKEHARWEATNDKHMFPSIMHGFVNVLEELARQIAGQPRATLGQALITLVERKTIASVVQHRITEAWDVRNRRPGVGHGTGMATKELAGFVLYRVCQGLSDLLDAAEAQQRRHV